MTSANGMSLDEALDILGITPGTSPSVARQAYRDLVKVWHPDRFAGDERLQLKATENLARINRAYEVFESATSEPTFRSRAAGEQSTNTHATASPPPEQHTQSEQTDERPTEKEEMRSWWTNLLVLIWLVFSFALLADGLVLGWIFSSAAALFIYFSMSKEWRLFLAKAVVTLAAVGIAAIIVASLPKDPNDRSAGVATVSAPKPTVPTKSVMLWSWEANQAQAVDERNVGEALKSEWYNAKTGRVEPAYSLMKGTGLVVAAADGKTWVVEAERATAFLQNGYSYRATVSVEEMTARATTAKKACDDWRAKPAATRKKETDDCVGRIRKEASEEPNRLFQIVDRSKQVTTVPGSMLGAFLTTGYRIPSCGETAFCGLK